MFTVKDIKIGRVDRRGVPWTADGNAIIEAVRNGWRLLLTFHRLSGKPIWWLSTPVPFETVGIEIRVYEATAMKLVRDGKIETDMKIGGYATLLCSLRQV